ncbi:MAG: isoprenoid biosynthesis glyoxalase ElbB [Bacteroidetes bacterium]|nr:isoprenoid biosynthesis glyoxalase ElbB [Bacteroidota bacterium]
MKKFAVVLAGCGVFDGAEITEAVLTLLAIDKAGSSSQCFAPDIEQYHVIDHLHGKPALEKRNVLTESARITRGNIKPMGEFQAYDFDALIFPGGFGAAKNLCSWAYEGDDAKVNPDVEKAVKAMHEAGKPIGAMCIAPVILAILFRGAKLTTGQDPASGGFIEKKGNKNIISDHGQVVIDPVHKLFTTPCYMLDATLSQIAEGTENIVNEMIRGCQILDSCVQR